MLHRACNLPLSKENFDKEVTYKKETAELNGYTETTIDIAHVETSFQT
jgi:hypothetical protein